jgi:hypothetical protein
MHDRDRENGERTIFSEFFPFIDDISDGGKLYFITHLRKSD